MIPGYILDEFELLMSVAGTTRMSLSGWPGEINQSHRRERTGHRDDARAASRDESSVNDEVARVDAYPPRSDRGASSGERVE
jgi:hypothetical protein